MDKYFDEVVSSIVEAVKFDSSMKPSENGYPFGEENAKCLEWFLSLANSFGFETHNYDNYVGEVVFGDGKDFAVLAHLDVVPAGSGWKYPPFEGVINSDISDGGMEDKKIWGRGTMDDKGPAVSVLYALKALKDEGFMPKRTVKLIVGCNEECGWKCIDHYNEVAVMPEEGFTPDADFPAIYAEKGILHFVSSFKIENAPFTFLKAGTATNMVCDNAVAFIDKKSAMRLAVYKNDVDGTKFYFDNSNNKLTVTGKCAHGSTPDKGANALGAMLKFFAETNPDIKTAYDILFADVTGLKNMNDETGYLTMSPDVDEYENGVLKITTDVRFPSTHKKEEIEETLKNANVEFTVKNYQAPLYNDPNGKLISTLMKVYNEYTGKNEKAIAIGGGTYARALKFGCGFGPELEDEEATIHQANEYVTFDRIKMMNEIYYNAIKELTK